MHRCSLIMELVPSVGKGDAGVELEPWRASANAVSHAGASAGLGVTGKLHRRIARRGGSLGREPRNRVCSTASSATARLRSMSAIMARLVALVDNWWTLFTRLADPDHHREALTTRPLLLHGIARQIRHAGQTRLVITASHGHRRTLIRNPLPSSCQVSAWQTTA